MPITVGLIKELYFIACYFGHPIEIKAKINNDKGELYPSVIIVSPKGDLIVGYRGEKIWEENVAGENSFFGIESCDSISRIMACIDNGTSWDRYKIDLTQN